MAMNYNSIQEIIDAGITNMTVIRNSSKQDDGVDTVIGVDWFTFNGTVASSIYVSGNSFFGFGTNTEQLKVNRRDGAMWSLYREEGTLFDEYKFLKIRWTGYSYYNQTSASYKLTYDVILWDTGDISLHMVDIPTSNWDGTFSLLNVNYTAPTVNTPDVTFIAQANGSFVSSNELIEIAPPIPEVYYKISNKLLIKIAEEIRKAAGLTRELKPTEMIYWLKRIICLPQGHADSEFELNILAISSTASGVLPEIARGTASSMFNLDTLNFTSTAVGALQEE